MDLSALLGVASGLVTDLVGTVDFLVWRLKQGVLLSVGTSSENCFAMAEREFSDTALNRLAVG